MAGVDGIGVDGEVPAATMAAPRPHTPAGTGNTGAQLDYMTAGSPDTSSTDTNKMSATVVGTPGLNEHVLTTKNDGNKGQSHSYDDASYVKVYKEYTRSSSQSSQSSAGTGGQSGASSIRSLGTEGQSCSSSVHSLEHIHSVTIAMLTTLMDKFQAVEHKEVKTAQDQLNNAQERLTTYGKNEENLKRAGRDLEMAKSNAELGYNSTEDILIKVHATRIICCSTMYLNYPASLQSGRDECIRRLSMLYKLTKVQEAFQKVTEGVHTTPGMLARLWSYPDPERTVQQDIVREVCQLDALIYRFLYSGGLIIERNHWPQVGNKSPMLLAYDRALLDETVPLFTSISLPGVNTGSGFVGITTSSNTATLVSKNAQHVAVADLAEDDKVEFVYESVGQDTLNTSSDFPSVPFMGVDSTGKVHFTTEGQDRVWIFTSGQPQQAQQLSASLQNELQQGHKLSGSQLNKQSQMLSGTLQCICGKEIPFIPRQIAVELADLNDGGSKPKTELKVVRIAAYNGIVDILVSTTDQAWVVRIENDKTHTTSLNVHCDLLPLQRSQCCLVPRRLSVLHCNLRWRCDKERLLCPGLYQFDTLTGETVLSDTSPVYITSHSGRLAAVPYGQPQQGQKIYGHPQTEPQQGQKSPEINSEQHQELLGGQQTEREETQHLSDSPHNDTKPSLLLVELCPDDPYCETNDTKMLRVLEGGTWKELASWKSTSQSKSLDVCVSPDGHVIAVLDDASIFIYDLQTGRELGVKTGLRDSNLSPCRICWYGDRFLLLTFKNTPEVHKIAMRL